MQINSATQVHQAQALQGPHRPAPTGDARQTGSLAEVDQLDISAEAELLSRTQQMPDVRADRVAQLRAEIAAGAYETDERLAGAVSRLLDEIG